MTLTQLRTFLAVVDHGSVRGAAEQLVVSQPAVSGAVAALEHELGIELVERVGRGLRVTAAGQAFAASVREGLGHLDRGVRVAKSVEDPGRGAVRLASIATAAERLLLPLLADFRSEYPQASVNVSVGNRDAVWEALARFDADLVVAGRPPGSAAAMVLGRAANTLVLVGPASADVGTSRRAQTKWLGDVAWLLREEGSGTRDATEELLGQLGIDPPRMILGSNGAIEAAVVAGFGVGLLPRDAMAGRLSSGTVVRIECPATPIDRPWHLVASASHELSPTAALAARSLLLARHGFAPSADGRRLLRR